MKLTPRHPSTPLFKNFQLGTRPMCFRKFVIKSVYRGRTLEAKSLMRERDNTRKEAIKSSNEKSVVHEQAMITLQEMAVFNSLYGS